MRAHGHGKFLHLNKHKIMHVQELLNYFQILIPLKVSHKVIFYNRFLKIIKQLGFQDITLKQNIEDAADDILLDKKHLENNPRSVTKNDVIKLLKMINENKV